MSGFSLFGVNLSGAEYDAGGNAYTYPSDAEIDYFAAQGFTAIRLPFLLERVQPGPAGRPFCFGIERSFWADE